MSKLFRRIWQRITNPTRYVGRDFEWNKYYEYPSSSSDPRRTKRLVQYRQPDDMWHYIGGERRLPVQWSAWLSHTRPDPPTLEELQADLARQHRVLSNAALIEARVREQRAQVLQPSAETALPGNIPKDSMAQAGPDAASAHPRPDQPHNGSAERSELPRPGSESSDEPQSWIPRSRLRHNAS